MNKIFRQFWAWLIEPNCTQWHRCEPTYFNQVWRRWDGHKWVYATQAQYDADLGEQLDEQIRKTM